MTLTHEDCKEARRKLGLSANDMARALGLTDGRAVRRYEQAASTSTAKTPRGPLAVLYRLILDGHVTADQLLGPAPPT